MSDSNNIYASSPRDTFGIDNAEWSSLRPRERINMLQDIENASAKAEHRIPAKVKSESVFKNNAGYNGFDHTIRVDSRSNTFDFDNFRQLQNNASKNVNASEAVDRQSKIQFSKPKIDAGTSRTIGLYSGKEYDKSSYIEGKYATIIIIYSEFK